MSPWSDFVRKVLIVLGLCALGFAIWKLRTAEVLLFGAILVGIMLRAVADFIAGRLKIGAGWALALSVVAIAVFVIAAVAFFGIRIEGQLAELLGGLPGALNNLRSNLQSTELGRQFAKVLATPSISPNLELLGHVRTFATTALVAGAELLLMIVAGVYLAAQPREYEEGLLRLAPERGRDRIRRVCSDCAALLRRWLLAQVVAMLSIGVIAGVGLAILGVPAPAALGVLAGICEFIPMLGPILAAIPALLMALTRGGETALWTLLLFICMHQFEGAVLQPLLQRGMTRVPPVLNLFALTVFAAFFGVLGVIFAAPLAIASMVLVLDLWPGARAPGQIAREAELRGRKGR